MQNYKQQFIDFILEVGALKFGEFELKSGRISPYFFNAGLFNSAQQLSKLGEFYAQAIKENIGDFVVSGGELPAMVAIDAISRQISGVLGNAASLQDSFVDDMLDYPHYTRPEIIDNQSVPEVLLSGNQAKIDAWRAEQAELATKTKLKN